jgi:hypothetical protein
MRKNIGGGERQYQAQRQAEQQSRRFFYRSYFRHDSPSFPAVAALSVQNRLRLIDHKRVVFLNRIKHHFRRGVVHMKYFTAFDAFQMQVRVAHRRIAVLVHKRPAVGRKKLSDAALPRQPPQIAVYGAEADASIHAFCDFGCGKRLRGVRA